MHLLRNVSLLPRYTYFTWVYGICQYAGLFKFNWNASGKVWQTFNNNTLLYNMHFSTQHNVPLNNCSEEGTPAINSLWNCCSWYSYTFKIVSPNLKHYTLVSSTYKMCIIMVHLLFRNYSLLWMNMCSIIAKSEWFVTLAKYQPQNTYHFSSILKFMKVILMK